MSFAEEKLVMFEGLEVMGAVEAGGTSVLQKYGWCATSRLNEPSD
jgi:hypothetical protein